VAIDLGARAPFQDVTDLLDTGMRMGQCALAPFDGAVDDFSCVAPTFSRPMMRRFSVPT
jgi:hypothetical protein